MKKALLLLYTIAFSIVSFAQDQAEEAERDGWSNETKSYILGVFVLFNIILVIRTFRNKPSA